MTRFRVAVAMAVMIAAAQLSVPADAASTIQATSSPKLPLTIATGTTVRAAAGKWSVPVRRSYRWMLNGKPISNQVAPSIKIVSNWNGASLQVEETAKGANGSVGRALSNQVVIGRLLIEGTPTISQSAGDSRTLQVALPTVRPAGATVRYVWLRNGFDIPGASGATYLLTPADKGASISVQVSLTSNGYLGRTIESNIIDVSSAASTYALLWSDEFSLPAGTLPDQQYWVAQEGDGTSFPPGAGWGNAERQYYVKNLAQHDGDGHLVITATRAGAADRRCWYGASCEWLSSKYVTQDKLGMKYGRVDVRLKGTAVAGTWPAFWLLGTDFTINTVRWPKCGELDVVELLGREPRTVHGTTHGPLSGGTGRGGTTELSGDFAADFHTYRMDWTPTQISFFVDDRLYSTIDKSDADWVFDHEFFLLLNLAMGGNWGGAIDANLNDAQLVVDFVRIFSIDGVGAVLKH